MTTKDAKYEPSSQLITFITIWDEEIGPVVVDFYPKSNVGDIEKLSIQIFQAYQFFYDSPDKQYKRVKMVLPIKNLNKKAKVQFDVIPDLEVRGGFKPFILVFLVPDYFADKDLDVYEEIMLKIARPFTEDQNISLEIYYQDILSVFALTEVKDDTKIELEEFYSYTVAMEDFQAGIKLFQARNYEDAHKVLKKVLLKFEQENHKHLIMEVTYLLASLYAQQKQFDVAHDQFKKLEGLAESLDHDKYLETAIFMRGFCAYKSENNLDALNNFERIDASTTKYLNKFQFFTIYGKILTKLEKYENALQEFLNALNSISKKESSPSLKRQQSQLYYEIGVINYKIAIEKLKNLGLKEKEQYEGYLNDSITNLNDASEILKDIEEYNLLIDIHILIGNVYEFLGDDQSCIENYELANEYAMKGNNSNKRIKIIGKIIQKLRKLEKHNDVIITIKNLLENIESLKFIDLYSVATLHRQLGEALLAIGNKNEGLKELIATHEIFKKFNKPVYEELGILSKIVELCTEMKEFQKVASFAEEINRISSGLHDLSIEKPNIYRPLSIIKEIWAFSTTSGVTLYTFAPETNVDHDLLGGFITAIQQFSLELSHKEFDSMDIGDDKFLIIQEKNIDFSMLGRASTKVSEDLIKKAMSIIYKRFWKEFAPSIVDFKGDISPFSAFNTIIEQLDLTLEI